MRSDLLVAILATASAASAFVPHHASTEFSICRSNLMRRTFTRASALKMINDTKCARSVNGEELELVLQQWELPLVVDAYATW